MARFTNVIEIQTISDLKLSQEACIDRAFVHKRISRKFNAVSDDFGEFEPAPYLVPFNNPP